MDIDHICEFVVLAEAESFLDAADKLFISQSTLSRHIKALEEELGVAVFDRTTRKVALNRYGQLFLPYAKTISRTRYEYTTAFNNALRSEHGSVRVGSIPVMAQYGITDVLVKFQRGNPNYSLDIIEADSNHLAKLLRSDQIDLAFVREDDDTGGEFNKVLFTTDSLAALVPLGHPLAKAPALHMAQLRSEPLLLLAKDTTMHALCLRECHRAGFEPQVVFTGHRAENIVDLAIKGMGIALLMKKPILQLCKDQLAVIDIEPRITTSIKLAYPKSGQMSGAARHFLEMVKSM